MTKTELITALQGKFHIVIGPDAGKEVAPNLMRYRVTLFDLVNDGLRDQTLLFYVENDGEVNEAAYWAPSEPKPDPKPPNPEALLKEFLDGKVTDGTVRSYVLQSGSFNVVTKTAVVNALQNDLTWQQYLVEYVAGEFTITPTV